MARPASWKQVVRAGETPPPVPTAPVSAPIPDNIIPTPKTMKEYEAARAERRTNGTISVGNKTLTAQEIRKRIQGLMQKYGYDPIEELMVLAQDEQVSMETRISIHKELANYVAPKLKSQDILVEQSMDITVNLVKFGDTGQVQAPNRESIPVIVRELKENTS